MARCGQHRAGQWRALINCYGQHRRPIELELQKEYASFNSTVSDLGDRNVLVSLFACIGYRPDCLYVQTNIAKIPVYFCISV